MYKLLIVFNLGAGQVCFEYNLGEVPPISPSLPLALPSVCGPLHPSSAGRGTWLVL